VNWVNSHNDSTVNIVLVIIIIIIIVIIIIIITTEDIPVSKKWAS